MNDKVNREGWFRKKGGRGHADKSSKRRYIILTERYLDWYTAPNDRRKGTVPLDQAYVRRQDSYTLVVGSFGGKEFKITYDGINPTKEIEDWYLAITEGIERAKKIVVQARQPTPPQPTPPPQTTVQQTVQHVQQPVQPPQQMLVTQAPPPQPIIVQQPPPPQQIIVQQPPPQPVFMQTYSPVIPQPSPQMMTQTTYGPYGTTTVQRTVSQPAMQSVMCAICRTSFQAAAAGGLVRCPLCQQVNNVLPAQQPSVTLMRTTSTPATYFY
jgi:hypothetical protein